MLRLLAEERKKLWTQRTWRRTVVLFALLSLGSLFYLVQKNTQPLEKILCASLQKLQKLVEEDSQPASTAYAYWQAELEAERASLALAQTALDKQGGFIPGDLTPEEESAYQAYLATFANITDQPYLFSRYVVQPLVQQCSYLARAEENYQAIPQKLEARLRHPLFSQESYARRSLERQKQVYQQSAQQRLKLSLAPEKIFDVLQDSFLLDGLLCLFFFAASRMIFSREREIQSGRLIAATPQGLQASARAKHLLYFLVSLGAICLAWGLSLLFLTKTMLQGDLFRSLQAVERYDHSPYILSVLQYLCYFFLQKLLVGLSLAAVLALLTNVTRQLKSAMLAFLGVWAAGVALYLGIDANSTANLFKFFSIWGLLDAESLLGTATSIAFLGMTVSRLWLSLGFVSVLFLLAYAWSHFFYRKRALEERKEAGGGVVHRLPLRHPFGSEGWRVFLQYRGLVLVLLAACVICLQAGPSPEEAFSSDRLYYLYHLRPVEGKLSDASKDQLAEWADYYRALSVREQEISDKYAAGELSAGQREAALHKLDLDQAREPFFYEVQAQIAASEQAGSGKWPLYVVDKKVSEFIFYDKQRQALMGLASSLVLILLASQTLGSDKQLGMMRLLQSTPRGHHKLLGEKFRWAWLGALGPTLLTTGAEFAKAGVGKIHLPWEASLYSLAGMSRFQLEVPIWLFILMLVAYRVLNLSLQAHLVICLAVALHSQWAVLLLSSGMLIFPQLVQLLSQVSLPAYWPLSNAFSLAQILPGRTFATLVIYDFLALLGILLSYQLAKRWYLVGNPNP